MGWIVAPALGGDVIWHNGGTGGFRAFLGFSPARGVGVAILTNSEVGLDSLGIHLIDPRHLFRRRRSEAGSIGLRL